MDYESTTTEVKAQVNVILKFLGIDASSDYEKTRQTLNTYCRDFQTQKRSKTSSYTKTIELVDSAIRAWSDCVTLQSQSLHASVSVAPTDLTTTLTFNYTGGGTANIRGVFADPQQSWECKTQIDGSEKNVDRNTTIPIKNDTITIICSRTTEEKTERSRSWRQATASRLEVHTDWRPVIVDFAFRTWTPIALLTAEQLSTNVTSLSNNLTTEREAQASTERRVTALETALKAEQAKLTDVESRLKKAEGEMIRFGNNVRLRNPQADRCMDLRQQNQDELQLITCKDVSVTNQTWALERR